MAMNGAVTHGRNGGPQKGGKGTLLVTLSYFFDWIILIAVFVVALVIGNKNPRQRPFQLENLDISFPYTVNETVGTAVLLIASIAAPAVIILLVSLLVVPGRSVPRGTPKSLIWRRKLWEWHTGWLGLALSLVVAWFVTNFMKNLCGKPRPDLLARCQPDLVNLSQYVVGGFANSSSNGQLVSGAICKNPDNAMLQDGFRSFPSGHSSSSAAGLLYLSLFLASKFAVTIPFLTPAGYSQTNDASFSAFPSRVGQRRGNRSAEEYELADRKNAQPTGPGAIDMSSGSGTENKEARLAQHSTTVTAVRKQAAAPPLYLLLLALLPTATAIFIAMSRWFDFRHHGFDIFFGFLIGSVTAWYSFRYYHLPISQGAGWSWGPRSRDKAFWAGVGSFSYATAKYRPGEEGELPSRMPDEETGYGHGHAQGLGHTRDGSGEALRERGNAETDGARMAV